MSPTPTKFSLGVVGWSGSTCDRKSAKRELFMCVFHGAIARSNGAFLFV